MFTISDVPRISTKRALILQHIEKEGSATGPELADRFGISRQAVNAHIRRLIADRQIFKSGSTRGARYLPLSAAPAGTRFNRRLALEGLDESAVYENAALVAGLSRLPQNVESITHYAFTEILNNAIDHSVSISCDVDLKVDAVGVSITIRDQGIGVFHSIASKFDLDDEQAALIELVKGKTTTQPDAHSGEGIFFVSKSVDRFRLRSHRLQITWDRIAGDVFVADSRFLKGTLVEIEIRNNTRTLLEDVFREFAPEEYDFRFAKTRVQVKLLRRDYVSRSEARRLLNNLDRFSEVELDMKDVNHVGQGFADEVFRVFASRHPAITVRALNTGQAVDAMIRHVRESTHGSSK